MNNITWWLIFLLNFVGYFIYSFGQISNGASKELIKFVGGVLFILSFGLMGFVFGWKHVLGLLVLGFLVTPLVVGFLMAGIEAKLFPYRVEARKRYTKKLNVPEREVERIGQTGEEEFWKEMRNKYKWLNNKKDGFIQIPILAIIISVLLASSGAGAVLYRQGKLSFNSKTEVTEQIENSEDGNTQEPSPTSSTIEASPVIKPVVVPSPTVLPSPSPIRKTVSVGFSEIENGKIYICYEDKVGEMVAANEQLKTAKQASEKYKSCVAEKTPTDEEKITCAKNCSKQYGGVYNEGCNKSCQGDFSGCGSEGDLYKTYQHEGILKFLIKDNCQHD